MRTKSTKKKKSSIVHNFARLVTRLSKPEMPHHQNLVYTNSPIPKAS